MSRFGFALLRSSLAMVGLVGSLTLSAFGAPPASPQLLPYTVSIVAGGGPSTYTVSPGTTGTTVIVKPTAFTVGQSCGTGSTLTATDVYGNGCLSTQVGIVTPRAVVADSQGNVFLIDAYNYEVRRVDAHTGIITAYAGGGFQGSSSTSATGPTLYTVGQQCATGSLQTAVTPTGDGCLATQISLAGPEGLAIDAQDNVWFSDYYQSSVRKISKATGIITTIVNVNAAPGYMAGNVADPGVVVPAAQGVLYQPYGITFDNNGNLYIADNYNNSVDAVNLGTSAVTIAGISIPAGAIYTIAGAGCAYTNSATGCGKNYGKTNGVSTASTLDSPYQVAVDSAGNIYIADEFPYDVRVINPAGTMSVFANSAYTKSAAIVRGPAATTSLASLFGVAVDGSNNVYAAVYDATSSSSYIDRVDIATGIIYPVGGQQVTAAPAMATPQLPGTGAKYCTGSTDTVGDGCPGTQATFYKPYQPFVDAAGNVYIADQGNDLVRKLSTGTQFPTTGQAVGSTVTQTLDVHFGAGDTQGTYTVGAGFSDFTLGAATCTTNTDTTQDCLVAVTFKPSAPGLRSAPLLVKSAGGLVSTFALTGTGLGPVVAADPGTQATLAQTGVAGVSGVALDQAGNTYAAVPGSASIVKLSASGAASNVGTGLAGATAVAVDPAGNVYAALGSGSVVKVPASGAAPVTIGSGFTRPSGVAADGLGNVYVADAGLNEVFELNAKTGVQRVLATASSAGLAGPDGLAVDVFGNVFVANAIGNSVVELPFAGGAPIALGSGLSAPTGVGTDAAGSLYVADSKNGRIVFIPNEAGKLTTADQLVVAANLLSPASVAVASGGTLTVADSAANAIYTFTRSASAIAFGNVATGTQATGAADIVSAGNVAAAFGSPYFTATGNTGDFSLTPGTLSSGASFAPGLGYALTAGFMPTVAANRSAVFTFAATNAASPTLTLTGTGITPVNATTSTIAVMPGNGTYGQTETITVMVAEAPGTPAPTGSVIVKVDTSSSTQTLANGTVTFAVPGLSAGSHTVTASYPGDATSSPSTAIPVTFTLAQAPLTIAVNSLSKPFAAALPALTGTVTGIVNNDQIGVTYSTTATQSSALGTYPITATLTGAAAVNYASTVKPGVLTVGQATTTTTLAASSYAVQNTTAVTLTATVVPSSSGTPTGMVTFLNGTTPIGSAMPLNGGVATLTTTFAIMGTSTTNVLTAVYSGDTNYMGSTSPAINVVSSFPSFSLVGAPTSLTVSQGQTGLTTFTVTPTFAYAGTITFSCTGLPANATCVFSPGSIASTGTNTSSLIGLAVTTGQPGVIARAEPPSARVSPIAFAGVPVLMVLAGMLSWRRRLGSRGMGRLVLLTALLALLGLGATGCGIKTYPGTATGTYTVTVIATGTPIPGGTANITQQFPITLIVH